eukprot:scaffold12959_cov58-Phaeocystis_antarctica.AAC.4
MMRMTWWLATAGSTMPWCAVGNFSLASAAPLAHDAARRRMPTTGCQQGAPPASQARFTPCGLILELRNSSAPSCRRPLARHQAHQHRSEEHGHSTPRALS